MMEYTAENLERAVCLFYRTEAGQQAEAHQWLTEAQNTPRAWSFVWELLHPQRSSEVQFFAATTLHTKLLKYWHEVPVDQYEILKKRILEAIINFAMGPKIVLNRLCITLSAFIIHTVPTFWPNAFEELVSSFQPQYLPNVEPERVVWILLEILTVIPEEFQSTTLATSQKNRVRSVLQEVSKDILKVVEMCLVPIPNANFDMSNLTTYLHSARCASAWIQLGGVNIDDCSRIMNLLVDLTCFVYWNRSDPEGMSSEEMELTEVTLEALTAVVQHPHTRKYRTYVMKHTANMLDKFSKIMETETASVDPNKDILTSIYLLIETTAESHSGLFLENMHSNNDEDCKITNDVLNCMLRCTDLPGTYPVDETSSTLSFSFWYTLQDDILSMDTAKCASLLLMVKPFYRQLVLIMLRKSMFPSNEENSSWSLDDKEMFRCYRQDIADTFMYSYNVLNLELLDILNLRLEEALQKCMLNRQDWNLVESCLHAFTSVAECIEMENLYLPKLMQILKNMPYADMHIKVLSISLECVGAYSEWMMDHPEELENVVPLVVSGLGNPEVISSATMALKDVTFNCDKFLLPYADPILTSCQAGLQGGNLTLAESIRLMYSVGKVISVIPVRSVLHYLTMISSPSYHEIQLLVQQFQPPPGASTRIITRLKMLSALFSSLQVQIPPNEPIKPVMLVAQNAMPLYNLVSQKFYENAEVMDNLGALLKHTLTTLVDDCKPMLNDIAEMLLVVYRQFPQPCVLAVAKTAIIMFGKEDSAMQQFLLDLVCITLDLCAELNRSNLLSNKTDVIEGFFTMMAHIYKKIPLVVISSGVDTSSLFQCAIICLSLPESQTLKVCTAFLVNFITHSRETSQAAIVQNYGESLVMRVLLNLGGTAPRGSIECLSDIILVLNKKYCDNLARWLHTLLQQEGFPTPRATPHQKENFKNLVLREKANKRKLSDSVMEFTLICRGIYRAEHTA